MYQRLNELISGRPQTVDVSVLRYDRKIYRVLTHRHVEERAKILLEAELCTI